MNKIWTNPEAGSDKIIALDDHAIYKGNPKSELYHQALTSLNHGQIPKGFFKIPLSYIRQIHWQEGKPYLQVFFSQGGEEHLWITNDIKRQEIFEYLKTSLPGASFQKQNYTAWQSAKKAIIATVVISILFAVVLDTAIRIEEDTYYGVQLVIVLFFAGMGVRNVILLFGALISSGIIAIMLRIKNRPVKHIISLTG